jgi:hypothetical protein
MFSNQLFKITQHVFDREFKLDLIKSQNDRVKKDRHTRVIKLFVWPKKR